jgi:hypothetical protein
MHRLITAFAFLISSLLAQADMWPCNLSMSLKAEKTKFTSTDLVQVDLVLTNRDDRDHSILVPGNQSVGLKLVYFIWYSVDERNIYKEVHRDSRMISMDTNVNGFVSFNRLDPGESTTIPFFFNDLNNASRHINSSYSIPNLETGNYKLLAWYYPWDEELSKYAFNRIEEIVTDDQLPNDSEHMNLPSSGIMSNYLDIQIISGNDSPVPVLTAKCSEQCKLCKAIEHEKWAKIKRIIRRDSQGVNERNLGKFNNLSWQEPHRKIAFLGDTPDAILASLPSYLSREIIFRNTKGIHYYWLTWQLGKTSRIAGRINSFFYLIGLRKIRLRDSRLNYSTLKSFTQI